MLCEKCKKREATTHIKSVVNGFVTENFLCDECAAEAGFKNNNSQSLSDFLSSIFDDTFDLPEARAKTVRCPVCGSSFEDITRSGKLGCSRCYETFCKEIMPYLKRVHGSTKHIGKEIAGNNDNNAESKTEEINQLKNRLKTLISEEKFEEAAVIRDKIKEMDGEKS